MSQQTAFVTKGATNVTIDVGPLLRDNSDANPGDPLTGLVYNSASLVCYYREGGTGAVTQLTLATQTVTGAHTDGGFVELSSTNMPGMYRLDLSDTIVSGTTNFATLTIAGFADLASHTVHIILTDVDLYDATRGGMTALPNANADAAGGLPVSDAGGLDLDALNTAAVRLTAARAQVLDDWINAGRLDAILDTIAADVVNLDGGTLITTAQVNTEVDTALADFFTSAAALVDLIWDEAISGHLNAGTSGLYMALAGAILQDTTITGTPTSTTFNLTAGSTIDDFYNDQLVYILSGTGVGQVRPISDYTGSTRTITVDEPWVTTPAAAARVCILSSHIHPLSQITADIDANSTQLAAILADTADIQPKIGTLTDLGGGATLADNNADMAGATFSTTTDSQEAIRDRGDTAWITGGGGGLTQSINPILAVPPTIDLANTASVRIGIILTNTLDDLPTTAEITPGTVTISRKAQGGTSWSAVVSAAAMSEQDGFVYYDEVFDSGTGYAVGDMIRIQFESVSVTADANTYNITGATGVYVYSYIIEPMRGTDGANTTVPDAAGTAPTAVEIRQEVDSNSTQLAAIVADTNELQTDWANGGRLDLLIDAILADTNELQTDDIPGLIAALNDLTSAQVQTAAAAALTAYDPPTNAEMEARTPTAAQLAYLVAHSATAVPVTFTGGTTTTAVLGNVDGSAASSTDDVYNSRVLIFNAGTLNYQICRITDYDGATTTATITAVTTAVTGSHTAIMV